MEQTKALNALEPFIALSKSATSPRAAADLVTRATSAPNTFIFAELLRTPQIQALSSSSDPDLSPYLTLLQIFSHGTYQTYLSTPNLPALNDSQTHKLRQLSLLTLARNRSNLSYDALQTALGLSSPRQLEDLVVSAVYAGLLTATLDPSRQAVQVTVVAPLRDLPPGSVPDMVALLKAWSGRCTSTLGDLEEQMRAVRAGAAVREGKKKSAKDKLQLLMAEAQDPQKKGSVLSEGYSRRGLNKRTMPEAGQAGQEENMDVDDTHPVEREVNRMLKRKM